MTLLLAEGFSAYQNHSELSPDWLRDRDNGPSISTTNGAGSFKRSFAFSAQSGNQGYRQRQFPSTGKLTLGFHYLMGHPDNSNLLSMIVTRSAGTGTGTELDWRMGVLRNAQSGFSLIASDDNVLWAGPGGGGLVEGSVMSAPNLLFGGVWYFVEVDLDFTSNPVTARIRLDGKEVLYAAFARNGICVCSGFRVAGMGGGEALTQRFFDDMYVTRNDGVGPVGPLGPSTTAPCQASADGPVSDWTLVGAATAWQALTGLPYSASTSVTSDTAGTKVDVEFDTSVSDFDIVHGVTLHARLIAGSVDPAPTFRLCLLKGGDVIEGSEQTVVATAHRIYSETFSLQPNGSAWTAAALTGVVGRLELLDPQGQTVTAYHMLLEVYGSSSEMAPASVSTVQARALMRRNPHSSTRLTSVQSRAILKNTPHTDTRLTSVQVRAIVYNSPDFRWIDMFSDLVFPHDISQDSDAATRFNTLVNEVASGHDQRLSLWDYPKMEYNVAYGVRTMEQLHDLIRFFRVMRGKLTAFRFLDHIDHTSNFATRTEARRPDPVTAFDQLIGTGDGATLSFQLVKVYDFMGEQSVRPIFKPIDGTVLVSVGGDQIDHFSCDYNTGIVTIGQRIVANRTSLSLASLGGTSWRVTANNPASPLPVLQTGEYFSLSGDGMPTTVLRGVTTASTIEQLTFNWPEGNVATDGFAAIATSLNLTTDNTPREGQEVRAGYEFHVPVRFDTDRLPVRLEYYGVGSANEITLLEVRPDEED